MNKHLDWRQFVEQRRPQLLEAYPCAIPTNRQLCPNHGTSVGPVTGICKPCRDQLYQQLRDEYLNGALDEENNNETPRHEQIGLESHIEPLTAYERLRFQHTPPS